MQSYGNGETIRYTYDSLDRVIKKEYIKNGGMYEYFYDCNGNLYKTKDGLTGTQEVIEYDLAGRVVGTSLTDSTGRDIIAYNSVRYNDKKGTVKSQSSTIYDDSNSVVSNIDYKYYYGEQLQGENPSALDRMLINNRIINYTYDGLGRLTSKVFSLSSSVDVSDTYTYCINDKNPKDIKETTLVKTHKDMYGIIHEYKYDANGNITEEKYGNILRTYQYDAHNRLYRYNDSGLGSTYVYNYDDRGNILNIAKFAYTPSGVAISSSAVALDTYSYGDSTWADLLTNINGTSISYDKIGNPLNWTNGRTLTWTRGRNLNSVSNGTNTTTFTYNSDGLRTKKVTGSKTTEYYVVDGTYVGEKTTINGNTYIISYVYDENGAPAGLNINGSAYYFVKNLQGDILGLMSHTGTVFARYYYDAWGNLVYVRDGNGNNITNEESTALLNPFRYRGYFYDSETGFYYLGSRYYDPQVCRFLNADGYVSTGQGFDGNNMFAYCGNNPVDRIDTCGFLWTASRDALIHNSVLNHICQNYSDLSWKNTCIKYYDSYTWGFCDLYNTVTGEVWELKKDSKSKSCLTENATKQLDKYVSGYLKHNSDLELTKPSTTVIKGGSFDKEINGKKYRVEYWDEGNGILRYSYDEIKEVQLEYKEPSVSPADVIAPVITSAVGALFGLFWTYLTGGTYSPIPVG